MQLKKRFLVSKIINSYLHKIMSRCLIMRIHGKYEEQLNVIMIGESEEDNFSAK
jgi:hypothetical protein